MDTPQFIEELKIKREESLLMLDQLRKGEMKLVGKSEADKAAFIELLENEFVSLNKLLAVYGHGPDA